MWRLVSTTISSLDETVQKLTKTLVMAVTRTVWWRKVGNAMRMVVFFFVEMVLSTCKKAVTMETQTLVMAAAQTVRSSQVGAVSRAVD